MISSINNNYHLANNCFNDILKDRQSKKMNAKDYLATLTSEELSIIQKEKCLAEKINISKLSEEGAENLLVAKGDYKKLVDLNNDGITEIGEGKSFIFPPPNAPDKVKDAWEEATANLSFKEKMLALSPFLVKQLQANLHRLPDGSCKALSPGDPGYRNAFGNTIQSYYSLINEIKYQLANDPERAKPEKQRYIKFELGVLDKFMENLDKLAV